MFNYAYDQSSRMLTVKEGNNLLATYLYDDIGRRTQLDLDSGGTSNRVLYTYEPDSALDMLQHLVSGSTNDVDYSFDYTLANQVSFRTVNNDTYQFAPVARTETYDITNGLNQYEQITRNGNPVTLDYDDNGNLTTDGTWTYTYDVENRLINATDGSTDVDYTYDPLGRRVKKDVNGQDEVFYLSDGTEEILELDDRGDIDNRYVFGPGVDEPVLMYTGDRVSNNKKRYYRADPQGSIIAITNNSGSVLETYTYDSYGNPDNAGGNAIRYTGRRWDAETGLYYYRARMYNPALGRFLQTDPVGYEDDTNFYTYVTNDPTNRVDPTGKVPPDSFDPNKDYASRVGKFAMENPDEALATAEIVSLFIPGVGLAGQAFKFGVKKLLSFGARMAVIRSARGSFAGAKKFLTTGLKKGAPTKGRTKQFIGEGGKEAAQKRFNTLIPKGNAKPLFNKAGEQIGFKGKLKDGTKVNIRTRVRKDGVTETTVELQKARSGSRIPERTKARFEEKDPTGP